MAWNTGIRTRAFFFEPGGGPILDMGPYYLAALCNLLGSVESVQAKTSIGFTPSGW